MKRLILLVIIMLASLIAFSQTGTKTTTTDSVITLPKPVAKAVVKDIIRLDSVIAENNVLKANTGLLIQNLAAKDILLEKKDSIITIHKLTEKNLNSIIDVNNLQKENLQEANKVLAAEIKKVNHKLVRRTVIGGVIIGGLGYLLLK